MCEFCFLFIHQCFSFIIFLKTDLTKVNTIKIQQSNAVNLHKGQSSKYDVIALWVIIGYPRTEIGISLGWPRITVLPSC